MNAPCVALLRYQLQYSLDAPTECASFRSSLLPRTTTHGASIEAKGDIR
jgi:hypothetical protein